MDRNMKMKMKMNMKMASSGFLTLFFLCLFSMCSVGKAQVPSSETFTYVNEGSFGDYIVEYDANYRVLDPFNSPFQLCFYNTTPGAYTLALRMGTVRSESRMRWVWEANRGKPVGENATLSLGTDGNLVLAEADGRVVWQTNTAGKKVVGLKVLPDGNMVLHDARNSFIWQSFDSPTDTLVVGQSLRSEGPNRLVSRLSAVENKNGPYSLVLERNKFAMYYTGPNSPKSLLYFDSTGYLFFGRQTIDVLTFTSEPENGDTFAYELKFVSPDGRNRILARPKYNATLTYLRLGIDGGLRAFTFYDKVDYGAWEETFTLFPRQSGEECQLPERCGKFGLCEDSQCVACPSANGLLGWSKSCQPPKAASCKNPKYYKLEGVDHFLSQYTRGTATKEDECSRKCTSDCKCAGYFFNRAESRCWVVNDLMTLTRVENSSHIGYIKV